MTKSEYIDKYYATDNYLLRDLIEEVWNDACEEMLKKINNLFLIDAENLNEREIMVFRKTIESINNLKPKLS